MGKLYPLLIILFLVCWNCEEQNITPTDEQDIISTTVTLWEQVYLIETTDTLYLNMNGLTGSIPPEIGNLTNLIYLNLGGNQFTGSIPPQIGKLSNLTDLNLGGNQLTVIPSEIGALTNLIYLNLGGNQLTGSIPPEIGSLTKINI